MAPPKRIETISFQAKIVPLNELILKRIPSLNHNFGLFGFWRKDRIGFFVTGGGLGLKEYQCDFNRVFFASFWSDRILGLKEESLESFEGEFLTDFQVVS